MDTGGHIFHLNFTNATAIQESQFISETNSSWGKDNLDGDSVLQDVLILTKR
ncbi:DUF5777 family beta-barrel protein [Sphingobacterium sp. E70]|uniref:DUF5777 family beta-barrel protein n=1 Tax=Sphingobacterium sp. E70 TaxID=2853439 RepID=UPI00359C5920